MTWNSKKKKVISTYQDQFKKFGLNSCSLFFPGRKQNVRFNVIKEIGIEPIDSILDVGCGFADLLTFLKENINYQGKYTGIDITPEFIDVCMNRHPDADFRVMDILQDNIVEQWDFVILTGTLNFTIGNRHTDFVKTMIAKMLAISKKGVSVDFVSIFGDNRYEYLYRANPLELFEYCRTLTKRVCLRYDYMPWEFTIYLYNDDTITEDNIFTQYKFPEIIKY
jgi:SAM-dependent methyltransferase